MTFRKAAVFAAAVFWAASLAAAPPMPLATVKEGEVVQVKAGGFADLTIDVPAGAQVVWRVTPAPVQRAASLPAGRLIFAGKAGTEYTATAIVVNFDTKKMEDTDYVVRFAGTPPPAPPGPVVPKPPAVIIPADLSAALNAAWQTEDPSTRTVNAAKLSAAFSASIPMTNSAATRKELAAASHAKGQEAVGDGLFNSRRAIGDWLNKTCGTSDVALDADLRKRYADAYKVIAAALLQLK